MDAKKQREVGIRMVKIGVITALILFAIGAFLMRLLHVSDAAVSVAGGIVLLTIALKMVAVSDHEIEEEIDSPINHHQMAVYPLAVLYLLNPAGMVVLIIASSKVESALSIGLVLGLILLVGLFDLVVFSNIDKLSKRMNPTTRIISEVVFGILLTALTMEMVVKRLASFGIIDIAASH
jgi:multiple antibiotic resistance protein